MILLTQTNEPLYQPVENQWVITEPVNTKSQIQHCSVFNQLLGFIFYFLTSKERGSHIIQRLKEDQTVRLIILM